MNSAEYVKLSIYFILYIVYHIVQVIDISLAVHLCVEGCNKMMRTVVVNEQIVHSENFGIFRNNILYIVYGFFNWSFAKNSVLRFVQNVHSCYDYKHGYNDTHDSVKHIPRSKFDYNARDKNR